MAEDNKSMDKGRRLLIGFIIVLLLLTAGAYFFGVYYFTEHFLPAATFYSLYFSLFYPLVTVLSHCSQ